MTTTTTTSPPLIEEAELEAWAARLSADGARVRVAELEALPPAERARLLRAYVEHKCLGLGPRRSLLARRVVDALGGGEGLPPAGRAVCQALMAELFGRQAHPRSIATLARVTDMAGLSVEVLVEGDVLTRAARPDLVLEHFWQLGGGRNRRAVVVHRLLRAVGSSSVHLARAARTLELLLDRFRQDPNERDAEGRTPLHYVLAHLGIPGTTLYDLTQTLLDAGADPNARCARGLTPWEMRMARFPPWPHGVVSAAMVHAAEWGPAARAKLVAFALGLRSSRHAWFRALPRELLGAIAHFVRAPPFRTSAEAARRARELRRRKEAAEAAHR